MTLSMVAILLNRVNAVNYNITSGNLYAAQDQRYALHAALLTKMAIFMQRLISAMRCKLRYS